MTQRDRIRRNIRIVRLLRRGYEQIEVAEMFKMPLGTVNKIAKEYGVLRRQLVVHVV